MRANRLLIVALLVLTSGGLLSLAVRTAGTERWAERLPAGGGDDAAAPNGLRFRETAIFASGCFWGLEESLRTLPGVLQTTAGFTGGASLHPTYEEVCRHTSGHVEAVRVVFNPAQISYAVLVERFCRRIKPTPPNFPAADGAAAVGGPAIFYVSAEQKTVAEQVWARWHEPDDRRPAPRLRPAAPFYPAEAEHQQYYFRHGAAATCPATAAEH